MTWNSGANVTVDRGALGPTIVGKGAKIDNLVQIAHNVTLGEHCLIVSQVGISGSTKLGNYVILAGQVGLAGHFKLGHRVSVAAQSGVMHNIPDGEKWLWTPAQPDRPGQAPDDRVSAVARTLPPRCRTRKKAQPDPRTPARPTAPVKR